MVFIGSRAAMGTALEAGRISRGLRCAATASLFEYCKNKRAATFIAVVINGFHPFGYQKNRGGRYFFFQ